MDKVIRIATKIWGYLLTFTFILIFIFILYMAIIYPKRIANKTELGMSRQQIELIYANNSYCYRDEPIGCMIGCDYNMLIDKYNVAVSGIQNYMIVWTGIDGVFVIGFDESDKVIFASLSEI